MSEGNSVELTYNQRSRGVILNTAKIIMKKTKRD